jgi:ribosomal protein S12 methylthiotransferase
MISRTQLSKPISVGMLSLGCPKTLVDSELILGFLDKNKYYVAKRIEDCDIAILNTCSFIKDAKKESIDHILRLSELKRKGRIKAIVVLGCLVQRYLSELEEELGEVDGFLGTSDYNRINEVLDRVTENKRIVFKNSNPGFVQPPDAERISLSSSHTRYLKISEGCDRSCSFCTIPSFRGKHRSRELSEIVAEAKELVARGARELVLIGQDTTYFGYDRKRKFELPKLLKVLDEIDGLHWIRVLYTYPSLVSDELIETIQRSKKMCHYLDIPLQHASDSVLRAMRRQTTQKSIYDLIEKLRTKIPDLAIRTAFIVGFPGEGENEFRELLNLIQFAKFDRLGLFVYSNEEGTPAAKLKKQVSERIKLKRFHEGMALQQSISRANHQKWLGKTIEVLIENKEKGKHNIWKGRSYMDAPEIDGSVFVTVPANIQLKNGIFVTAKVNRAREYDLIADYEKKTKNNHT